MSMNTYTRTVISEIIAGLENKDNIILIYLEMKLSHSESFTLSNPLISKHGQRYISWAQKIIGTGLS